MVTIRIAWAGLFTLLALTPMADGLPLELSEDAESVVTPAADLQGLQLSWKRADRGPAVEFTHAPGKRLVLQPWEAGRLVTELSLGIPAVNEIDGNQLSWSASPLRQDFEVTTEGVDWSLELNWKSPAPASEGPAYIDFVIRSDGLEYQVAGDSFWVETQETGRRLAQVRGLVVRDANGAVLPTSLEVFSETLVSNTSRFLRVSYEDGAAPKPFRIDASLRGASTWLEADARGTAYARRIAPAGDVNGDGHADLLIGARFTETTAVEGGRVLLHLGGPDGLDFEPAWTLDGNSAEGFLGAEVAGAGDVNGDGFDDLLIGEPGQRRILLFLGAETGPGDSPDWTFVASSPDAEIGWTAAIAADLDGDGFDDVVLGEPRANGAAALEAGRVLIFLGGEDGPAATADQVLEGEQGFARFGAAVSGAGDVDGDGRDDLLVGAPLHDGGHDDSGLAQLFTGASGGVDPDSLPATAGEAINARCGESLAELGDLDGDGFGDVAVGCPSESFGRVEVLFGPDLLRRHSLTGVQHDGRFGTSIAGGADFDGDGRPELIVGAPGRGEDHGAAVVFTLVGRQLVPQPILTLTGELPITQTGMSVAALGDCDRDGFGELAVGSWYATGRLGWAQGRVTVLAGQGRVPHSAPLGSLLSGRAGDEFGSKLGHAGDLNGDGFGDLWSIAREAVAQDGDLSVSFGGPQGPEGSADWVPPTPFSDSGLLSAAGVGDVNGDGFDDLLVGAALARRPSHQSGTAALYFGSADGPSDTAGWNHQGVGPDAREGEVVAPAGDLNGDGLSDFLVISKTLQLTRVFHGRVPAPDPEPVTTLPCGNASSFWAEGRCGVGIGDFDGDGFGDLVLVSPSARKAVIHFGSAAGVSLDETVTIPHAASEVSAVGDLTGDGRPEVAIRINAIDWQIWSGGSREPRQLDSNLNFRADWIQAAGDVDADGRDDVLVLMSSFGRRWELRRGTAGGLAQDVSWERRESAGPRRFIGAAAGFDGNGDGLSDLQVGFPSDSTGSTGVIEIFPGSGGGGSRRAPVLRRHDGVGVRVRAGRRVGLQEGLEVEFGLDVPGRREDLRIEWKLDADDDAPLRSDALDSGPPPGELPAPGLRGSASFATEREGLWRPRHRLTGSEPVPWTSPWSRLPRLGGGVELRVAENRAPSCGFSSELIAAQRVLLTSTAEDHELDPVSLSWDTSACDGIAEVEEDPAAGTLLLVFEDCAGSCEVGLSATDRPGLNASCSSEILWTSSGTTAGPDRRLSCSEPTVVLAGAATLADPAHGLLLHWEPAALVSNPNSFTPTTTTPGEYTFTVTDTVTGCVESDSVLVLDGREDFEVSVRIDQGLDCAHRAAVLVVDVPGTGDYSYSWTPRFAVSDPEGASTTTSTEGTLFVEVTSEATGCSVTASVTVVDGARAEPSALDQRPDAEPFRLARGAAGRLALTWEDTGSADWSVFRGSLHSLAEDRAYDHASVGACHLATAQASISIPPLDSYYLVATDCGANPAFGRSSTGNARPPTLAPCP